MTVPMMGSGNSLSNIIELDHDRRIEYAVIGEPRPGRADVVLLHEGLGSVAMWGDFPRRLAETCDRRVIAYSRFGYGHSSGIAGPRTPDYMHEEARIWLPAILEHLGIRRPVLLGHSDGASIALIYGAICPQDVTSMILLAPHVLVEDISIAGIEQARSQYERGTLRSRLAKYHDNVDATFWAWNRIWLAPEFRDWNIESLLPSITAPILAIQGRDDEYGTMDQLRRLQARVSGTEVHELGACRHAPHRDQRDTVLQLTKVFVERIADDV